MEPQKCEFKDCVSTQFWNSVLLLALVTNMNSVMETHVLFELYWSPLLFAKLYHNFPVLFCQKQLMQNIAFLNVWMWPALPYFSSKWVSSSTVVLIRLRRYRTRSRRNCQRSPSQLSFVFASSPPSTWLLFRSTWAQLRYIFPALFCTLPVFNLTPVQEAGYSSSWHYFAGFSITDYSLTFFWDSDHRN